MLKRDVKEMVEYLISERKSFKVTFANGKVEVVEYRGYCWVLGNKGYSDKDLVKKMVRFQNNVSKFIIKLEVIEEVEEVEEMNYEKSLVEEVENLNDDLFQEEDLAYCEEAIERETHKKDNDIVTKYENVFSNGCNQKLVFGKGLNIREERDIKNYGKELNKMKKYLVNVLGLVLSKAHKVIQTLNRNNKVLFNNGETSFFIKIKEVKEMKNYKNLVGKKWCEVPKEVQNELLSNCNIWSDLIFDNEEVIIDLTGNLSIDGKINLDSENVNDFEIDDNAIIYDPTI